MRIIRISSPDSGSTVVEAALVDGVDGVAEKLSLSILVLRKITTTLMFSFQSSTLFYITSCVE